MVLAHSCPTSAREEFPLWPAETEAQEGEAAALDALVKDQGFAQSMKSVKVFMRGPCEESLLNRLLNEMDGLWYPSVRPASLHTGRVR